jgi:ABC-type dipeptide/oligopeptide/nickel transport system permease component
MVRLLRDPTLLMVPLDASPEFIEKFREQMGFNDPMIIQYIRFIRVLCTVILVSRCVKKPAHYP